jgi:hypothetical protein
MYHQHFKHSTSREALQTAGNQCQAGALSLGHRSYVGNAGCQKTITHRVQQCSFCFRTT